jgi:hypothetical protein
MPDTWWRKSNRADPRSVKIADRHYNRQKIGSPQFVPPGRCFVLRHDDDALWVTSYPFAQYVKHAWAGAWVNSLFRNETDERASELIRMAVAHTRTIWPVPELGLITFVDSRKIAPKALPGYCYKRAGFKHVGFTKAGLWAWQLIERNMPEPQEVSENA